MSLLKRIFGRGEASRDEPESLRRIVAELDSLPPERQRYVAAFTFVLARVAHADLEVSADELRAIEHTVSEIGGLDETEARLATRIAVSQTVDVGGTDNYVVTRELRQLTDKPARVRVMRCILAVAAADDSISSAESREVVAIGEELGFSRPEVSALRYEFRDKLAETRKQP